MPSAVDIAKRSLVTLLKELAAKYRVTLDVNRESSDEDVTKAYRKVCLQVHPDKDARLLHPGDNPEGPHRRDKSSSETQGVHFGSA